ncbi:carbon monoxide dehydrogenase [Streptacidiphilus sp. PB12-B1b]|uniref:SRPBCC family protein n=1 Tax=Streptacidiphilus sp. PB12-B1b TaxID=2705012 RepID=UPI0015F8BCA5|nr:SRPBCC domain-containing protein [Streptacidiphilus sp. PB12-B1b]QMU77858.1 carbon monoxide dehydrogenase [Streptacidiphilus sp. PB12-B1b]
MDFSNEFRVSLPVEPAWDLFNDVERIVPCMPGAALTGTEGEDRYHGTVKVKVGPVTVQYKGVATFEERDAQTRTVRIKAAGRDSHGQGNADAEVTVKLTPDGDGTRVAVGTHLSVTGKAAQFGKSVMEDISRKLLDQFVDCLERRLATERRPAAGAAAKPTTEAVAGVGANARPATRAGAEDLSAPENGAEGPSGSAAEPATGAGPKDRSGPKAGANAQPAPELGSKGLSAPEAGAVAGVGAGADARPASEAGAKDRSAPGVGAGAGADARTVRESGDGDRSGAGVEAGAAPQGLPGDDGVEAIDLFGVARGALLRRVAPLVGAGALVALGLAVWLRASGRRRNGAGCRCGGRCEACHA